MLLFSRAPSYHLVFQVLVALVAPYRRMRLQAIASRLSVSLLEAESLAVMAIRDGKLQCASVDQVGQVLLLQLPPEQCWQSAAASSTTAAAKKSKAPSVLGSGSTSGVATGTEARYTEITRLGDQLDLLLGILAGQ